MTAHKKNLGKKILLTASAFAMLVATIFSGPIQTNAQASGIIGGAVGGALAGCGSALTSMLGLGSLFGSSGSGSITGSIGIGKAVPVTDATVGKNTSTIAANTTTAKNVQCTWSGIAWQMAHIVLHSIATSVVNWINTGFKGNPSFLKNPQAFFIDAGDQITGAFLSGSGPLSQLCSPFSVDIQVALALEHVQPSDQRYTCTLGTIIKNAQNGVNVTVNGQNINSFMKGNFSAGGWSSFITMTTVPQNNPFGAYLQSSADLNAQIGMRHASLTADIQLGSGFLSWNSCTDVTAEVSEGAMTAGAGSGITASVDAKGNVTYQSCTMQTPGSVISSSLSKQLGASTDELNMTNDINEVVSAFFSYLVKQVIVGGGLLASSQPGSGTSGAQSYIDQLANDPQMSQNFTSLKKQAVDQLVQDTVSVQQAILYRSQSLALVTSQQNAYAAVRACIANDVQQSTNLQQSNSSQQSNNYSGQNNSNQTNYAGQTTYLQGQLSALDSAIATNITPQVAIAQASAMDASSTLIQIQSIEDQVNKTASAQDLVNLNTQFSTELDSISSSADSDPQAASDDFQTATTLVNTLSKALIPYQSVCNGTTNYGTTAH